ncbi:MAG: pyridoxal-phosphate dependent enzyme [Bacteroidaceae bacterium]|nr:pyridoxal-phosphate dependent enzyme [Bacteroidaceae bacterium]
MAYRLVCRKCGKEIGDFAAWFNQDQLCECGSNHAEAVYDSDYRQLDGLCAPGQDVRNLYHYRSFLPLDESDETVSFGEGAVPIEEWTFLSDFAREKYGKNIKVVVCRNDLNGGTGTFKDIAASLAATLFKKHGVKEYCLASTGNAATAYATYLAKAGVKFDIFAPHDMYQESQDAIRGVGQNLIVSDGGYGQAKSEAAEFHKTHHVMISAGNIDPIRVEAKKTLVFECLRQLGRIPDVYMQAVAGGTSPIAFEKGMREIASDYPQYKMPRMLLVQQDTCDPMVQAWEWASANGFPEGWNMKFPSVTPHTRISILTAGTPGMYPLVGPIVRNSGGGFIRIREEGLETVGRMVKDNTGVYMGPASAVCIAGFFKALEEDRLKDGDLVLLNTGEGSERALWFKKAIDDCKI